MRGARPEADIFLTLEIDIFAAPGFAPAAFTRATGQPHWEILLRARAVENQAYVVAPNQCGRHAPDLLTHGHSAIVDPWGEILAAAGGDEPEVIIAELRAERLAEVRSRLPALAHRRLR